MRTLKVNRVLCAVLGATLAAGIVPATAVPRANADGWTIVQYTSYDGNAVLQTDTVNGYAYALSEVRGGLVYPLVERDAYFTPSGGSKAAATPDAALGDGAQWYKPGAGTLVFQDLVPGKTYRLSGISAAALPAGAGPAAVAAAYTDTTMKAAKDSAPTNLTLAPDGQAASVVLGASDSRAEYALLTKDNAGHWVPLDADGTMLTPASQTASWQAGTGAALSFDGLSLGRGYRLIARSAGYSELSWSVIAANEASGVVEIEIPQAISDVTVAMVSRSSSAEADLVSLTGVDPVATYHILNAHTGEQLWQGSGADHYTASLGARQSSTLQVVAEAGGAFTRGVRVYPYPVYVDAEGSLHTLTVDYVAETVTSADAQQGLPADIQFRIDYSGQNLITTPTTADGFLDAPGGWIYLGAATPYTAAPILDSIESGAATLTYRLRPSDGYDGAYLAPASTLSIPARPEFTTDLEYQPADSSGTAPAVDWSRFRWGEETIFG
ncbi:MAG: hypothetical protein LBR58_07015, partial [Propionibacteriaceae bacterium]|nr:hypothetical protein [Propionibacteriaceae bacterium]